MLNITINGKAIADNIGKEDIADQTPIYNCGATDGLRETAYQIRIEAGLFPTNLVYNREGISTAIQTHNTVELIQNREDLTTKGGAIIHVNRSHIAKNRKDGGNRPVFTLKIKGKTRYARGVVFTGDILLSYRQDNPLSCGARAWIESPVDSIIMEDEMSFAEAIKCTGEVVRDTARAKVWAHEFRA